VFVLSTKPETKLAFANIRIHSWYKTVSKYNKKIIAEFCEMQAIPNWKHYTHCK